MKKLSLITGAVSAAAISLSLLTVSPASAATVTFVTPTGATTSGGPVDASATFTTSTNTIAVTLSNLEKNITDVAQAISDLFFTFSGSTLSSTPTLTSSSGQEVTVNSGGTFSLGSTVSTGFAVSSTGPNTLLLNVLGTPTAPAHLIIGPPGPGNLFSNANGSIAGNGPHNPFLFENATFDISLAGITASTVITGATFSFGTTAGINVAGVPSPVPLPGAFLLFSTVLVGGLGLAGCRKRRLRGQVSIMQAVA